MAEYARRSHALLEETRTKMLAGIALARSAPAPKATEHWAIAEGYIPGASHGPAPQMTSHETVCLLNAGGRPAHVQITIFFVDREPAGPSVRSRPGRDLLAQ